MAGEGEVLNFFIMIINTNINFYSLLLDEVFVISGIRPRLVLSVQSYNVLQCNNQAFMMVIGLSGVQFGL